MVNDLSDTNHKKPKIALRNSKSLTHLTDNPLEDFSDSQTNSINNPTGFTFPPPFHTNRPNRLQMTRLKLFSKWNPFHRPTIHHRTSTFHSFSVQHPILPNYPNVKPTPSDIIVENNSVTDDTDSPTKIYSKTNYPFSPPSF